MTSRGRGPLRLPRAGVTLVELLVVLAIMAVMAGVATFGAPPTHATPSDVAVRTASARRAALASGRPVSVTVVAFGHEHAMSALPNGVVIADSLLGVDRLTGVVDHPVTMMGAANAR